MKLIILSILIVLALSSEEQPAQSAPMEEELHIFGSSDTNIDSDDDDGIFPKEEFKKGMGPMDQFFLKDLFETVISAFEGMADDPSDAAFLQEANSHVPSEDVIKIQSPLLGLFNPLFTVFQVPNDADFMEIETVSINGQTQTKVTKTSTRNGLTTTTTEITTSGTESSDKGIIPSEVSGEFVLQENPVIEEAEKFIEPEELAEESVIVVNLDQLNSYQDVHVVQDKYVNNEEITAPQSKDAQMSLAITITSGIMLTLFIGYSIKKCAFKK